MRHSPRSSSVRRGSSAACASALALLVVAPSAHALASDTNLTAEPPPRREAPASTPPPPDDNDRFRIGALAGVGFPRPISFEAMTRLGGYVAVGAEYGMLPTITIEGVAASTWAATFDLRVFPFHGAFFLATRAGYQHLGASATVSIAQVGSASGAASLDTWFVNPRVGFLWRMRYGFTIAMEAGIQLPVTSSFSTTLPNAIAMQVRTSTPVETLSGVLPTVDLLRVGMLF